MEYVYKYVEHGITKYVGITSNLSKRFYEHTRDKLKVMDSPNVWYFPVKYRADAEMLETYLINHYGTKQYYNVAKANKGEVSFLDICDKLPWVLFNGIVDNSIEPFLVSKCKETIYEPIHIYIDKDSDEAKRDRYFREYSETVTYIDFEILQEKKLIASLQKLLSEIDPSEEHDHYKFVEIGLYLHKKRLQGLTLLKRIMGEAPLINNKRMDAMRNIIRKIRWLLEQHENRRYDDDWKKDYYSERSYLSAGDNVEYA